MNNTQTAAPIRTLAEMNNPEQPTRELQSYVVQPFVGVGRVGHKNSGSHTHLIFAQRIVGYVGDFSPARNQYQVGQVFSAYAPCNSNGQNIGRVVEGRDTDAITCALCKARVS